MKAVTIYTDGACSGNPGPGGWAFIIMYNGKLKGMSGHIGDTTNQRAEIIAVIKALETLKEQVHAHIFSDSQYVVNTMTKNWKRKANLDLWNQLDELCKFHDVDFTWVKAHSGNPANELVDRLAQDRAGTRR